MRLDRLLVGDDGSPGAAAARRWATALAVAAGGEVTTVHATEGAPGGAGCDVDIQDLPGTPTAALLAAADEVGADLVVVGRRGAGGFDQLRLGSVAHQLAEHTARPVAVVPGDMGPPGDGWPFATIVVGHDGSPAGASVLAWVAHLAPRAGARVVVTHAVEVGAAFAAAGLDDRAYEHALNRSASQLATDWSAPLRDAGCDYETVVEDAGPATVLLGTAQRHRANLLVVGRRDPASFSGMEMGSVAHRALGFAPCPVVVVPATS
jgi:nucleotide-binding universal stress UspA family protein